MKQLSLQWRITLLTALLIALDHVSTLLQQTVVIETDSKLAVQWTGSWASWKELAEDQDLQQLINDANSSLSQSSTSKGKGKKGKS